MVKHQVTCSDLILTHYNGRNPNKKVLFQKQGNKLIYLFTQKMRRIILFCMVEQIMKTIKFTQTSTCIKLKPNTGFHVTVFQ